MMPCITRDQTVIVNHRNKVFNGLHTQPKPKQSFSIDALMSSDSRKDASLSPQPSPSTPSPSSGNKSISPPLHSSPLQPSKPYSPLHHQIPQNELLRFMNSYHSSPQFGPSSHSVLAPPSAPPHGHQLAAPHAPPPPHPHPMALSMMNSMPRTNQIAAAAEFYNNVNHGFGHWSPYLRHSPLMPHIPGYDPNGVPNFLLGPFRKPKRIRTAFSPSQLLRLEEVFEKNQYVVGTERKQLARDLNLSETQIKVWFQNRRTKHKRVKHEEGCKGNGVMGGRKSNDSEMMSSDDEDIDTEDDTDRHNLMKLRRNDNNY